MTSWTPPRLSSSRWYSGIPSSRSMMPVECRRSSIVSNSGTMLTAAAVQRPKQPDLLQQQRHLQDIRHTIRLGDDAVRHRSRPVAPDERAPPSARSPVRMRLLRILDERRAQRPRRLQLLQQQRYPRVLVKLQVGRPRRRRLEQVGHRPLMHVGVLAEIQPGQMEAEHRHRMAQRAQPSARQNRPNRSSSGCRG